MREPSGAPAAADLLFPELVGPSEPAPPARSRASRLLRTLARVALWSLIAAGAFRGLLPSPSGPSEARSPVPAVAAEPSGDHREEAVAAAFLREYLTVGDDRAGRARRLGQLAVAGIDLGGSVSVPDGVAQYADHVVPTGSHPVPGGIEVTVLAHVLQVRSGACQDGGTLAFVVPLRSSVVLVQRRQHLVNFSLNRPIDGVAQVLASSKHECSQFGFRLVLPLLEGLLEQGISHHGHLG
jgi:hypothetical protein